MSTRKGNGFMTVINNNYITIKYPNTHSSREIDTSLIGNVSMQSKVIN